MLAPVIQKLKLDKISDVSGIKVLYLARSTTNTPSLSLGGQNGACLAGVVPGKFHSGRPCLHLVADFTRCRTKI